MKRWGTLAIVAAVALGGVAIAVPPVRRALHPVVLVLRGSKTVDDRMAEFAPARGRLVERFAKAGIPYPPKKVIFVGLKQERRLELYAATADGKPRRIGDFPILAASGGPGPKRREGDRQVPEGIYAIVSVNPNSRFHAALRVGYPNELDLAEARAESRSNLGGDIMIHGGSASIGCLAMGDPVAEELFVLAVETGCANLTLLLCPFDLRTASVPANLSGAKDAERYELLKRELTALSQ